MWTKATEISVFMRSLIVCGERFSGRCPNTILVGIQYLPQPYVGALCWPQCTRTLEQSKSKTAKYHLHAVSMAVMGPKIQKSIGTHNPSVKRANTYRIFCALQNSARAESTIFNKRLIALTQSPCVFFGVFGCQLSVYLCIRSVCVRAQC